MACFGFVNVDGDELAMTVRTRIVAPIPSGGSNRPAFEMDIGIASACRATLVRERWETRLLVKCG
jgi:hypothetical protein